jgi:hypothetical protein
MPAGNIAKRPERANLDQDGALGYFRASSFENDVRPGLRGCFFVNGIVVRQEFVPQTRLVIAGEEKAMACAYYMTSDLPTKGTVFR